jgi:hypothetical protein
MSTAIVAATAAIIATSRGGGLGVLLAVAGILVVLAVLIKLALWRWEKRNPTSDCNIPGRVDVFGNAIKARE